MDIGYLREFLTIIGAETFSEAAEELYTTSSSLSKHMRALEEELGMPLFKKVHRNSVMNENGELLVPYARDIVAKYDELLALIEHRKKEQRQSLNVVAHYRLFEEALEFRKKENINVIISEFHDALGLLEDGSCEIAVLVNPDKSDRRLEGFPYRRERMVFVCNRQHPLANRTQVSFADIRNEYFVAFPKSDQNPLARLIYEGFSRAGYQPRIAITATVGSTIAKLIAEDAGVGILWEKALQPIMMEELRVIPLIPAEEASVEICWLKDRPLSENARKFQDFMRGKAEEISFATGVP